MPLQKLDDSSIFDAAKSRNSIHFCKLGPRICTASRAGLAIDANAVAVDGETHMSRVSGGRS
jgi:hypothetical protein